MAEPALREEPILPTVEETAREIVAQARRSIANKAPVFLLVVYDHEQLRRELISRLQRDFTPLGIATQLLDPRHNREHGTGHLYPLLESTDERCLSLLSNLPLESDGLRYDSEFLTYLNFHRDRISQRKLRLVLFLPSDAMETFIRLTGDLWDYRQHTWWLEADTNQNRGGLRLVAVDRSKAAAIGLKTEEEIEAEVRTVRDLVGRTNLPNDKARLLMNLAESFNRNGAPRKALALARDGLALRRGVAPDTLARLENALAVALCLDGRATDAVEHFVRALEFIRPRQDNPVLEAEILVQFARVLAMYGRLDEALERLAEAQEIYRQLGMKLDQARTLISRAWFVRRSGELGKARQMLDESLELFRSIHSLSGEADVLVDLAHLDRASGQSGEALRRLEQAREIRRRLGDTKGEADVLGFVAEIYWSQAQLSETGRALEEVLVLRRATGDHAGEAVALWNLAHLFEKRGELERAIDFLRRAADIEREIDHPDLVRTVTRLAELENAGC